MPLREDIATARLRDPAARSGLEVFLTSAGLHAIWWHRIAHRLWRWRLRLPPVSLCTKKRHTKLTDRNVPGGVLCETAKIRHQG